MNKGRHWTGVVVMLVGCAVALIDVFGDGEHVTHGLIVAVLGAGLVDPETLLRWPGRK